MADTRESVTCETCGAPHHVECWSENGGCAVTACPAGPADVPAPTPVERRRPSIVLSEADLDADLVVGRRRGSRRSTTVVLVAVAAALALCTIVLLLSEVWPPW